MDALEVLKDRKWEHPSNYGGFSPVGDYVILSRTRDSDALEESNYECAFKQLLEVADKCATGPDPNSDDDRDTSYDGWTERVHNWVYDFRAGHWAMGWVEYLLVRDDAPEEVLQAAAEIVCSLESYPVLDEMDFSERENEYVNEAWEWLDLRERIRLCAKHGSSIFAARRKTCPDNCYIYEELRTP